MVIIFSLKEWADAGVKKEYPNDISEGNLEIKERFVGAIP